jgi:hypothetical protein
MSALCVVLMGSVSAIANTITMGDESPTPISPGYSQTTVDPTTNPSTDFDSLSLPAENPSQSQPSTTTIPANPFTTTLDDTPTGFNPGGLPETDNSITPTAIPLPLPWEAAGIGLLGVFVVGRTKKMHIPRVMRTRTTGQSWA